MFEQKFDAAKDEIKPLTNQADDLDDDDDEDDILDDEDDDVVADDLDDDDDEVIDDDDDEDDILDDFDEEDDDYDEEEDEEDDLEARLNKEMVLIDWSGTFDGLEDDAHLFVDHRESLDEVAAAMATD